MTVSEPFLTGQRLVRFEALQHRLVPRSQRFDAQQQQRSIELANTLTGNMPAAKRRKLGVFLILIDVVSFFVGFRPFRKLSGAKQLTVLGWLFDSPVGLLRKGFWGLNSIAKLSVYGQPSLYDEIGYRLRDNPRG